MFFIHAPMAQEWWRGTTLPADSLPTTKVNGLGRFAAGVAKTSLALARNDVRDGRNGISHDFPVSCPAIAAAGNLNQKAHGKCDVLADWLSVAMSTAVNKQHQFLH